MALPLRISTRGRYGLRAMVDLAVHADNGPVALREIAERQDVSSPIWNRSLPRCGRRVWSRRCAAPRGAMDLGGARRRSPSATSCARWRDPSPRSIVWPRRERTGIAAGKHLRDPGFLAGSAGPHQPLSRRHHPAGPGRPGQAKTGEMSRCTLFNSWTKLISPTRRLCAFVSLCDINCFRVYPAPSTTSLNSVLRPWSSWQTTRCLPTTGT